MRRLSLLVAVGAVAVTTLVAGGAVAAPAEARTRGANARC